MRTLTTALAALALLIPMSVHAARHSSAPRQPAAPRASSAHTTPSSSAHRAPSRTSMRPPIITEGYAKRTIVAAVRAKSGLGTAIDVEVTFPAGYGRETSPRFLTAIRPAPNVRFAAAPRKGTYGRIDTLKLAGSPEGTARVAPHKFRPE